jgi:intein-encoded DNA endonuclease-like protein
MSQRLTDDQIKEIIKLYQSGKTPLEIAKLYNIYNNSITRILRKNNIPRIQLIKISQDQITYIIDQYNNGLSSEHIANILKINASTVLKILKKNNIEIRPTSISNRKHKIDQNIFEKIDNEYKAYFLGYLYADGAISFKRSTVSLTSKDEDVIKKFSYFIYGKLKYDNYVNPINDNIYYICNIYSRKLKSDLTKYGCTPKKSFTVDFNDQLIDSNLLHHFIRGFFDGDGCICLANKSRPVIDFTSNIIFISSLKLFIKKQLNIICNKIRTQKPPKDIRTANVQITSFKKVKIILDYMYSNSTIYMDRKYNLYLQFLGLYNDFQNKHKKSPS